MLCYEFDIFCADKARAQDGQRAARGLTATGQIRSETMIALFRSQETADAVTAAPSVVRLFLEETGFGFTSSVSGAPAGYFPTNDGAIRDELIEQMTGALSNRALKKALIRAADHTSFNISSFINSVASTRIAAAASMDDAPKERPKRPKADAVKSGPRVVPRRPNQLRSKSLKSRLRPQ